MPGVGAVVLFAAFCGTVVVGTWFASSSLPKIGVYNKENHALKCMVLQVLS
jgi:hypothetical protein